MIAETVPTSGSSSTAWATLATWLGVGDAAFRQKAQDRLMGVVQAATIFILASHDFGMVRLMCNKFVGMAGGRATGIMPIEELDAYLASVAA